MTVRRWASQGRSGRWRAAWRPRCWCCCCCWRCCCTARGSSGARGGARVRGAGPRGGAHESPHPQVEEARHGGPPAGRAAQGLPEPDVQGGAGEGAVGTVRASPGWARRLPAPDSAPRPRSPRSGRRMPRAPARATSATRCLPRPRPERPPDARPRPHPAPAWPGRLCRSLALRDPRSLHTVQSPACQARCPCPIKEFPARAVRGYSARFALAPASR